MRDEPTMASKEEQTASPTVIDKTTGQTLFLDQNAREINGEIYVPDKRAVIQDN